MCLQSLGVATKPTHGASEHVGSAGVVGM
jgi:hypothetical protein